METEGSGMIYLKCRNKKNEPSVTLYPAKLFFKSGGKINTFPDKQILRELVASKYALQEILILKEALQAGGKY